VEDTSCLTLQPEADVSLCTYTCAYCHLSFVISVMKQM
jgi:wyosine [tRNA(Phe)-imidazoG37] synthetase (radical SAM superfamily)